MPEMRELLLRDGKPVYTTMKGADPQIILRVDVHTEYDVVAQPPPLGIILLRNMPVIIKTEQPARCADPQLVAGVFCDGIDGYTGVLGIKGAPLKAVQL